MGQVMSYLQTPPPQNLDQVEKELDQITPFFNIVRKNHQLIQVEAQLQSKNDDNNDSFKIYRTKAEEELFHRFAGQDWAGGFVAGAVTFVALNAFSYWWTRRAAVQRAVTSPITTTQNTRLRNKYVYLDGKSTKKTTSTAEQLPLESQPETSDNFASLENLVFGAISLFVTTAVATSFVPANHMVVGLANLPLAPGQSTFLHRVCPQMVAQGEETPLDNVVVPETAEFEAFRQMLLNCKLRIEYQQKHETAPHIPVYIPEPGLEPVTKNYNME